VVASGLAALLAGPGSRAWEVRPEPAAIARTVSVHLGEGVHGLLSLPTGVDRGKGAVPGIALIIDAPGPDGRGSLYALRFLSLGLAVLETDTGNSLTGDWDGGAPRLSSVAAQNSLALTTLRTTPGIDPARVAIVASGGAARRILLEHRYSPGATAMVLLYPGCDDELVAAAARAGTPILLLHGDADPANEVEACARLAAALGGPEAGVTRQLMRGASFAWDVAPIGPDGAGSVLLADPAAPGRRLRVHPDPRAAFIGLDRILGFLLPLFGPVR
jgi:dienelactone hydrolase